MVPSQGLDLAVDLEEDNEYFFHFPRYYRKSVSSFHHADDAWVHDEFKPSQVVNLASTGFCLSYSTQNIEAAYRISADYDLQIEVR